MARVSDILNEVQVGAQGAPEGVPWWRAITGPAEPTVPIPQRGAGAQPSEQPIPIGAGLYADPTTGLKLALDEVGNWRPASPAEIRAWEKLMGGAGGAAPSPLSMSTDPALLRLEAQAREQAMELAASQEARAVEAHPVEMAQAQSQTQVGEQNFQRQLLSDKFTVAQSLWDAAQLADQLASAKRKNATDALTGLVDYLVPPGMDYWPGMEPGGPASQIFGQADYNYTATPLTPVATVDFAQFTQGLSPETDQALRYLQQTGQQTTAGLGGLGV